MDASDQTRTSKHVVAASVYYDMVQKIAKSFPHIAIRSQSPKSACYFYNVYLKEAIQDELNDYIVALTDVYSLLSIFGTDDLNFNVKQKNAKGFFQAIASYAHGDGDWKSKEVHMLTAEAGTRERAITKLFTFHLLVWNPDAGIWRFSDKLLRDKDDF